MQSLLPRTLPRALPLLRPAAATSTHTTAAILSSFSRRSISYKADPSAARHARPNPNKATKILPSTRPLAREPVPPPTITAEQLKDRAYAVRRTPFGQLPLYRDWKSGDTQILVRVKKVNGDKKVLAKELVDKVGIAQDRVSINPTTGHIHVKGDYFVKVRDYLLEQGF